jgi:Zn-dependent oligopeptidase
VGPSAEGPPPRDAPAAGVELMEARRGGVALGSLYLDLLSREGKPPGTAHATLRTNRHGREVLPEGLIMTALDPREEMSPREASTLFHELGHFLHLALSETWYAESAGTRAPIELVEVPSTFVERCFFTRQVLEDCGLPRRACDEILALERAERPLKALELARNTLVDMELHGSESLARDPVGFIADVFAVPRRRAAAFAISSTHFVHYPNLVGTYYLADRAVDRYWGKGGFRALEEEILRHGIERPGFSLEGKVREWLGEEKCNS